MENQDIAGQIGEIKSTILSKIGSSDERISQLQKQVDTLDRSLQGRSVSGTGIAQLVSDKRGTGRITLRGEDSRLIESKTTVLASAVGYGTTGVLQIDRAPRISSEARQRLTIRSLLSASPTSLGIVDFVSVSTPLSIASPQTEGSVKAENQLTFTSKSEKVQTLATWIPASRQIMDDFQELGNFLQSGLTYYLNLAEESQLLYGSGTGNDLDGLVTQSTPFNVGLLGTSWTRLDIIGDVISQITTAKEIPPTFVVLHPADWWKMRLLKNSLGNYILGDPQTDVAPSLFGLTVCPTVSIAPNTFLVGSGDPEAAEIRDRMESVVEISSEHSDFYVRNLVAIRAEKRLCLLVRRRASFVSGTFTTSP